MTVHFVATDWDQAMGRFVGPVALLNRAKELLPELKVISTRRWEWRSWVDLLEGSGALRPVFRWRVPGPALARLWADLYECAPEGEASSDAAVEAVAALRRWNYAKFVWGDAEHATQDLHPLDDPRDGAAAFVEDPSTVPWSPTTYDPVMLARRGLDRLHADDHGCVPLFRRWQALLLVELFLAEPRRFAGLDRAALTEHWSDLASGPATWQPRSEAGGFAKHHGALEALSWHATYVHHALMLTQKEAPDRGMFASAGCAPWGRDLFVTRNVIRGAALAKLREAETRVAREALRRHGVDEETMLDAASWLGHAAVRRLEAGHAKASRGYAELMREAVELVMTLGRSLDEVKARMRDGAWLVAELFPVWLDRARRDLRWQFLALAADFGKWSDPRFPPFDEARVDEFVEWLEQRGLLAAHMSVPAIMEYGQRTDRDAKVGVAVHVASLAAWVEHTCNELLGPTWNGGNALALKLPGCWSPHSAGSAFEAAWKLRHTATSSPSVRPSKRCSASPLPTG